MLPNRAVASWDRCWEGDGLLWLNPNLILSHSLVANIPRPPWTCSHPCQDTPLALVTKMMCRDHSPMSLLEVLPGSGRAGFEWGDFADTALGSLESRPVHGEHMLISFTLPSFVFQPFPSCWDPHLQTDQLSRSSPSAFLTIFTLTQQSCHVRCSLVAQSN